MHEYDNGICVETICGRVDQSFHHRCAQRSDTGRPLVASGPQHGARLAHPPQPPASQGQSTSDRQANVENVRSSGDPFCCQNRIQGQEGKLAAMGAESHDSREPLHTEGKTHMVGLATAPEGPVSVENVIRLLEHQHYRCALTGRVLTPETASIDHILPIRLGGAHTIENAQVLHKDVNRAKGSMTSEEFIGMCREVARWSESATTREETRS